MARPYFQFKQFQVFHDRCAMKVGTDGVLLGAWVDVDGVDSALDIGTGCGLIALMLAQRSSAWIDAVEIEDAAWQQATGNVARSPWAQRVQIHHGAVQNFAQTAPQKYDLLVSNPPYFSDSLKAEGAARNQARHNDTLRPHDLLTVATTLLQPAGRLAVIYPTEEAHSFLHQASQQGWCCRRKLSVQPRADKPIRRILLELDRETTHCAEEHLAIETETRHEYTSEYAALTRDFYLRL